MQERHYNIPVFIPHLGCPHHCVFCGQEKISGTVSMPSPEDVTLKIENYLSTMPPGSAIEAAFFGGSFTAIPFDTQKAYLEAAYSFIKAGRIRGIRLSTRPDCIDQEELSLLKEYGVTAIELGAQSMDADVLKRSGRGHTAEDVKEASFLIKRAGISLGLQMMIGLPGDTFEKAMITARAIADLGADTARVYPTLVIHGTALEKLYLRGAYNPLSLEEAVSWCADILQLFEERHINVIRMGLHPSEELMSGEAVGPFHPSFRELVLTEIWRRLLKGFLDVKENDELQLFISPAEYNYAIGFKSANKIMLSAKFKKVIFKMDQSIKGRFYGARYS
jgi:histone acetyltransferase (RNA polymerase elongator complex component)